MRKYLLLVLGNLLILIAAACTSQPPEEVASPSAGAFRPKATVKEIMDSVVDPNADFIWESVIVTVSAAGIEEKAPRTDEEWKELRRHTIALLESTNLLLIPERHVAQPGEKAEDPNVELSPDQIETMINQDRATWNDLVYKLYDAVLPSLEATDAKDKEALLMVGDRIDTACEGCHLKYWYPNDKSAQEAYAEQIKAQGQ